MYRSSMNTRRNPMPETWWKCAGAWMATVESRRALVRTSELNLEYATIRAPINGRIGDSLIQVGGLVSHNAAQPLTTIVPLDPIWVRFKVSESEYLTYQRREDRDQTRL